MNTRSGFSRIRSSNRVLSAAAVVFALLAVVASAQDELLVPAVYLAPEYTAPSDAPSSIVVADRDEPGERLIVSGRALYGSTPVGGASIFVFQTDAEGVYAPGLTTPEAELRPRLHGVMRTDSDGRYRYETVRPGSYDGNAAHVHYIVIAAGYKPRLFDLWFQDDPILAARRLAGEPQIPQGMRSNEYYLAGPDFIAIRPVVRDDAGTWHAVRDLDMIAE
jgi:protocatechuate 3,4-dioxygenase beta subunit